MRFRRRPLEVAGLGVVLALCAAAFGQPLLLFGAAGVGAWLLGRQRAFVAAAESLDRGLAVRAHPTQSATTVDTDLPVVVTVELDAPSPLAVAVEPTTPVAATTSDASTLALDAGETRGELSYTVAFHVAGRHDLPPVELALRDREELFAETVERPVDRTVTVGTSGPSRLHVGRGASSISELYDAESQITTSRGLEPQELREYVTGDLAKNIDWNATARLGDLYVRQYGTENARHAVVVLDRREAMNVGPAGETKFDYARELALGYLESVDSAFDSVALYSVDEDAIASRHRSQSAAARETLRDPLLGMRPRGTPLATATAATRHVSPVDRVRLAGRLRDGAAAFDRNVGPYVASHDAVETGHDDPVRTVLQREYASAEGDLGVVFLTDDTAPDRVWETVQFARRVAEQVTLFLTPHVLFERGGLADLETAYERYLEFEAFRRKLDELPGVTAFEVGPRDRFRTVVGSRRGR